MSENEGSSDNIGKIIIQLDELYKHNPTLDYIKKFEEERKILLETNNLGFGWEDPSIQEHIKVLQDTLEHSEFKKAFKTYEDYISVTNPLISALKEDNLQSLLKAFKIDMDPYLDSAYSQTLKATELFSETLQNISDLNLPKVPDYFKDMQKTISIYESNLGLGNKSLIELATSLENEAFKTKFELSSIVKETLNTSSPVTQAMSSPVESSWLDNITESKIPQIELSEISNIELPRPEDSPHYKQNEKILNSSKEQIALLKQVSVYMSSQTEKLEFLNEITLKQVEDNKVATEKQMEENRITAEKEMAINAKSSRLATWIAISSIFLTLVVSIIGIWTSLYIYKLESISNNKDHSEVVKLLKENNPNKSISELVKQLKIQNKNFNELQYLKKDNEKMKALLEIHKSK